MLRPYIITPPCVVAYAVLEPFCQTEPHDPILLRPVEWMHYVHLADRISQQVHAEGDSRAAHEGARAVGAVPAEQLRAIGRGPGDAGVVEDSCLDREDAVIGAALAQRAAQQAEWWEPQLDAADQ